MQLFNRFKEESDTPKGGVEMETPSPKHPRLLHCPQTFHKFWPELKEPKLGNDLKRHF